MIIVTIKMTKKRMIIIVFSATVPLKNNKISDGRLGEKKRRVNFKTCSKRHFVGHATLNIVLFPP